MSRHEFSDLLAGLALLAIVATAFFIDSRKRRQALPPSPPGLPLLGNALQLNSSAPWETLHRWSETLGDIISVSIMGKPMIVLDSLESTTELLEKRSANYSDRPEMPMIKDLMGWSWTFALMSYGNRWREHRKVFVKHYMDSSLYRRVQETSVQHLLRSLSQTPEDFFQHLRRYTGYIIMKRTYDHEVTSRNDPYVELVDKASTSTSLATKPPGYMVDLFPFLKYVPSWFPGAGFKRQAQIWRKLSDAMVQVPYNMAKKKFLDGSCAPCFVSTCLELQSDPLQGAPGLTEELIRNTAAVAYAAGVDTTASSLTTFVFAMVLHPEVQKQAQAELDQILGDDNTLPSFTDRSKLPFVTAIVKETLRWIPVLPLGVPHRSINGDDYKGYWIPPGTTVIPNTWAILHNPSVYENPSQFNPMRYITNPNLPDPTQTFGYGRRSCAGKDMALDALWLAIVNILYVYNIEKALDAQGKHVTPEYALSPGSLCQLLPFPCKITPREEKEALLRNL